MVGNFYKNVLDKVLLLEKAKKDLSRQILLCREDKKRLNFIRQFLQYELNRHELFEHAAVAAMNNRDEKVLKDIARFYGIDDENEVLSAVRSEISINRKFITSLEKVMKYPRFASFSERRLVKEIEKYILEKARIYNQL